MYKQKYASLLN